MQTAVIYRTYALVRCVAETRVNVTRMLAISVAIRNLMVARSPAFTKSVGLANSFITSL